MAVGSMVTVLAGAVLAQPGGGGRGGRINQDPVQQGGQGGPPDRAAMMAGRGGFGFGLDEQQRQVFNEALQKHQETLRKLEEQLLVAQRELIKVVIAEEYVEKTVREKAEVVAKLQTEIMMLRSQALHTVAPTLRTEQRVQMEDSRFSMMLLSGGFGGGGRMGMMGGPQGMDQPPGVAFGGPGGPAGPGGRDQFNPRGGPGGQGGRPDAAQGGQDQRGNRDRGNRGGNRDGGQPGQPGQPVEQRPPR